MESCGSSKNKEGTVRASII